MSRQVRLRMLALVDTDESTQKMIVQLRCEALDGSPWEFDEPWTSKSELVKRTFKASFVAPEPAPVVSSIELSKLIEGAFRMIGEHVSSMADPLALGFPDSALASAAKLKDQSQILNALSVLAPDDERLSVGGAE